jgi:hypothetical protein
VTKKYRVVEKCFFEANNITSSIIVGYSTYKNKQLSLLYLVTKKKSSIFRSTHIFGKKIKEKISLIPIIS